MKLFFTDKQFQVQNQSYPEIPFLVDKEMVLVDVANDYLRHVAVIKGRAASSNTWKTYGNHLYEFFEFLEANNFKWNRVNQTHLAAWRDSMLERGCKRSTVNQRLNCVASFYQWAMREGKNQAMPFYKEDVWVSKDLSINKVYNS